MSKRPRQSWSSPANSKFVGATGRRTGAQPAVAVPVGQHVVDRRAQRRQADAAGDDDDVASLGRVQPATACRTGRGRRRRRRVDVRAGPW